MYVHCVETQLSEHKDKHIPHYSETKSIHTEGSSFTIDNYVAICMCSVYTWERIRRGVGLGT